MFALFALFHLKQGRRNQAPSLKTKLTMKDINGSLARDV